MLLALALTLLSQRSNNIAQGTQALVDALCLLQSVLVRPRSALFQPLATSQVDQIEAAITGFTRDRVLARDTKREHGM